MNPKTEEQIMKFINHSKDNRIIIIGHASGCEVLLCDLKENLSSRSSGKTIDEAFIDALSYCDNYKKESFNEGIRI